MVEAAGVGGQLSGGAITNTSYKEYLRSQFIYKDFRDLNLRSFPALVSLIADL